MGERIAPTGFIDIPKSEVVRRLRERIPQQLELKTFDIPLDDSLILPLDPNLEVQFRDAAARGEFKPVDDFSKEPLGSPVKEKARELYQDLISVLPNFGFTDDQIKYGMRQEEEKKIWIEGKGMLSLLLKDFRNPVDESEQVVKAIVGQGGLEGKYIHFIFENTGAAHISEESGGRKLEGKIEHNGTSNEDWLLEEGRKIVDSITSAAWDFVYNRSSQG